MRIKRMEDNHTPSGHKFLHKEEKHDGIYVKDPLYLSAFNQN
jgi:hypothetical protein